MTGVYNVLLINQNDNVAVALENIIKGQRVKSAVGSFEALGDIEKGHKVAIREIKVGEPVIKYGYPIGRAVIPINAGEYVHTHNIKTNLQGILEYSYNRPLDSKTEIGEYKGKVRTFKGYLREDGKVGIRNEIWIVNTVGCVNKTAELLANKANIRFGGATDGVYAFLHPYGCSQMGDDQTNTQKILAGMANHPNAAGVLVLGLGCENNNIAEFKKFLGQYDEKRIRFLEAQAVEDEIEEGLKLIGALVEYASSFKRQDCPVSKLVVGLKCGGSDAFSGITANPLTGLFSDMLIEQGGTTLLTEVPEMFGAETILMNRCINEEIFNKTVNLINDFKEYYMKHNQVIYENPSPGNKKGGISTLEEKSLGCTQKGGAQNVVDVLDYGEAVRNNGLNLLKGPGNDIVAITALAASGVQLILFTTGRGTPLGAPVPTIKISSNKDLFNKKKEWIDFDAGQLVEDSDLSQLGKDLFDYAVRIATGEERTKNEINGYREIAIFKDGVTL
ncbi:MAG: altronate dehydratase family protein [Bacillota bacterium]|nr:altronate dehydratase family protein [Bacillota bacterium]